MTSLGRQHWTPRKWASLLFRRGGLDETFNVGRDAQGKALGDKLLDCFVSLQRDLLHLLVKVGVNVNNYSASCLCRHGFIILQLTYPLQ